MTRLARRNKSRWHNAKKRSGYRWHPQFLQYPGENRPRGAWIPVGRRLEELIDHFSNPAPRPFAEQESVDYDAVDRYIREHPGCNWEEAIASGRQQKPIATGPVSVNYGGVDLGTTAGETITVSPPCHST